MHSHSRSFKMFSAVIAGYISGSLFPACCESAGLSHCRPPLGSPPPHNSEVSTMPYLNQGPLSSQETSPILRETCNWISKFHWLLFHCSVFSVNKALERVKGQSTSGLMVIWECKDNLILRGLLP